MRKKQLNVSLCILVFRASAGEWAAGGEPIRHRASSRSSGPALSTRVIPRVWQADCERVVAIQTSLVTAAWNWSRNRRHFAAEISVRPSQLVSISRGVGWVDWNRNDCSYIAVFSNTAMELQSFLLTETGMIAIPLQCCCIFCILQLVVYILLPQTIEYNII